MAEVEKEELYADDKKVASNGVFLCTSSMNSNCRGWETIYEDGGWTIFEEGVYPVHALWVEAKNFEGVFYELEGDAIKGFGKVDLQH